MLPGRMLFISIAQQADVGFSRRSTDVIQLALTLKMTTAQVVETSVTFNNNSPIQDYVHPDDQTQPFPLFSVGRLLRNKLMQRFYWSIQSK